MFIVAAVFIVGTIFLTRTRDGLRLMAVGANAEAVRRAGIHSDRYKVVGFVISGTLAAVGGLVNTANVTEANPAASPAIIFTALTAGIKRWRVSPSPVAAAVCPGSSWVH